ncbi:MAG: GAF domain-containing protein [Chloroflexia bacterium]|nr:GAF domain-containing protein [Chloroflexia bacterium]
MARQRRKKKGQAAPKIARSTSWLMLGGAVLILGLLLLIGYKSYSPPFWLYPLLVLALLGLVLGLLALNRGSADDLEKTQSLTELTRHLVRQLAEQADPSTALFGAIYALQQHLQVERIALFAIEHSAQYAELLVEAQQSAHASSLAGRLALERLPKLHQALQQKQPQLWKKSDGLALPPDSQVLLASDYSSLYLCPLLAGKRSVGFLSVSSNDIRRLQRLQQRGLLESVAQILALYIRTAGLQPDVLRAQDQIELLYEVTTHLNTDLSLEKVLTNLLSQSRAKVGATRGSLFLLDEEGHVTHRILARENLAPEISQLVIQEIMTEGLPAWVLENKKGTIIQDTLQDNRWLILSDHAGHVRSAVAAPFIRQGRVQGMIFLTHPDINRFRQEHLNLLNSIANQAAIAIQNARLYERVQAERRTLAAVLDSSADAIVVTTPAGNVLLANPAARQVLGIENRPAPLAELVFHPQLLAFLQRALHEEDIVCENVTMDDNRTFSVSVSPVHDQEGRTIGRVALMHDITYLVELDEMKSRFVSTVSHDLKAPLTAIRGFIDLIEMVGPTNEEQHEFVGRIQRVTEEMSKLISDLLDLGKIEAGLGMETEPVDMRDILLSGKYNLAMMAQDKGILVDVEASPGLPQIHGDPYRLQQVTSNLLSNAIKYTPRGGHIWVRASNEQSELVVCVQDTGIGIPSADLPRVFDKFFRVSDTRVIDQEGSGLGLAIVKSIVEEHGGRVWAESNPGKGSRFYFALPVPQEQPEPAAQSA